MYFYCPATCTVFENEYSTHDDFKTSPKFFSLASNLIYHNTSPSPVHLEEGRSAS